MKIQSIIGPPDPPNGQGSRVSCLAVYAFDDNRRMYAGTYTLKDTKFREGRDDWFFTQEDAKFIAKLIREVEPDKPWLPFYPEHAYKGKLWIKSVFELVWIPTIDDNDGGSTRWQFNALEEIRVYERAIDL